MKKLGIILLIILFFVVLVSCSDKTEKNENTQSDNENTVSTENMKPTDTSAFHYIISDNSVTIDGYYGTDTRVIIPQEIDGLPVTELGSSAFYKCYDLEQVELPSTIKTIGRECFFKCGNLKRVLGIEYVKYFEFFCFGHCSLEGELVFRGDTVIDDYAFAHSKITGVKFFDGNIVIGNGAFEYTKLKYCFIDSTCNVEFDKSTFENCLYLQELIIPNTVTSFPKPLFYHNNNITTIYTPKGSYAEQQYYKNYADIRNVRLNTSDYEEKVKQYAK